eukprot:g7585.t1
MASGFLTRTTTGQMFRVREVWDDNLEEEMALLQGVVDAYPYVAMDTEFPGVVVRPVGEHKHSPQYQYLTVKFNVDLLKLIQLGLSFTNADGELPTIENELCVWQFNFKEFRMDNDIYALDSIELLQQSGIDFARNQERGIDVHKFGELLMTSGIVLNEKVQWITFHSGYDFGYLLKLVTGQPLPNEESKFFELLKIFFPIVFDIKYLMKFCDNLHGGLNRVADALQVKRIGPEHQAGSDSLLTSLTFIKLVKTFFYGVEGALQHAGILYGLGVDANTTQWTNEFTE